MAWEIARMHGGELFRTNDAQVIVTDRENNKEDDTRRILVDSFTRHRRGQGFSHIDAGSEALAQKICDLLNSDANK